MSPQLQRRPRVCIRWLIVLGVVLAFLVIDGGKNSITINGIRPSLPMDRRERSLAIAVVTATDSPFTLKLAIFMPGTSMLMPTLIELPTTNDVGSLTCEASAICPRALNAV